MVISKSGTDEYGIDYNRMKKYRVERANKMINKYGLGALITWDEINEQYLALEFACQRCLDADAPAPPKPRIRRPRLGRRRYRKRA